MHKFLLTLLMNIIPLISGDLKKELDSGMDKLEERAKSTPNKFDDILVDLLKTLIGR